MGRYKPNSGKHILDIINRTTCGKHGASYNEPCFVIYYNNGKDKHGPAICGSRVLKAGFNGEIHPNSLGGQRTVVQKPNFGQ